jgi:RES domain-containing protein
MARAYEFAMEQERRGWKLGDGRHVCPACVEDGFLKKALENEAAATVCDFCGRSHTSPIAAPFDSLVKLIAAPLLERYNDVDRAATPSAEGKYLSETLSTGEVLEQIEFGSTPNVWHAVVDAFTIEVWVEAPGGSWGTLSLDQELRSAWDHFCWVVKHQTRFHFHRLVNLPDQHEIGPGDMLDAIATTIDKTSLVKTLDAGTVLYRGRRHSNRWPWTPNADSLGAPPHSAVKAGRMNPAGIPYLYLAFDTDTMLAELGALDVDEIIIGAKFNTTRPLRIVDFTDLPRRPSLFEPTRRHLDHYVSFLQDFTSAISRPAVKNGTEEIHYVPTQVVSEFLAQAYQDGTDGLGLDGVVYPSAKRADGRNLVLFPSRQSLGPRFSSAEFVEVLDWNTLMPLAPPAASL